MRQSSRILLVDDHPGVRRMICSLLQEAGYQQIDEAAEAQGALKLLETKPYDLVLIDAELPGISGIDLLKVIRGDARTQMLPVLLVTAQAGREQMIEAAKAGLNGYILKPFGVEDLKARIGRIQTRLATAA
jgi:two-component system chemotaxis response regulator CheY